VFVLEGVVLFHVWHVLETILFKRKFALCIFSSLVLLKVTGATQKYIQNIERKTFKASGALRVLRIGYATLKEAYSVC
jgi:hypothetical protein